MKQFVRLLAIYLSVILSGVVVALSLAFVSYDLLVFQSRKQEIVALLAAADPEERALPPDVAQLIEVSLSPYIAARASRLLIQELQVPWLSRREIGWQLTQALWEACIAIHLSHEQQLTIVASQVRTGGEQKGYAAEARRRYGRRLSELGLSEAATVVASSRAPSNNSSSALQIRRDYLLSKLGRGT